MSKVVAAAAAAAGQAERKLFHGVVVSASKMDKTFKVKLGGQRWEPRVQKNYKQPQFHLVHDPANSVRQGDVVAVVQSWRHSKAVRHCVEHIVSPYGEPIESRPPIPSYEERVAARDAQRSAKQERRQLRKSVDKACRAAEDSARQAQRAVRRAGFLASAGGAATPAATESS